MKIVTWNCNGALRKKTAVLDELGADVLVIQECEDPYMSTAAYREWAGSYLWRGANKNKGLGIFVRDGLVLEELDWSGEGSIEIPGNTNKALKWSTGDLEMFLPCKINDEVTLLAAWTKPNNSPSFRYIGQLWKYMQINRQRLSGKKTVLCGDLNSNPIWDEPDRWWNHSDVVQELAQIGMNSIYHVKEAARPGEEPDPTFYMHRKLERPYHIDYAFVSEDLISGSAVHVGGHEAWLCHSDHMPLIVDIPEG